MTNALAWTLIHFLWEGALIALALAVALGFLRRARLRYAVACAALLTMLCAFAVTFYLLRPHTIRSAAAPLLVVWSRLQPASEALASPPPLPPDPLRWLVPLWMLGAGLCGLRTLAGWLAAQRLRRTGVCAAPEHWQQRMRQLADRLRVSRPVVLLESCLTEVPVAMGFLRPAILIPAGLLTGFPPEQIECFLLHELAHIRRWDYFINLLQSIAEDLLFYHPAVWWVSSIIRAERENCCDDVAAAIGDAHGFARALAALEHSRIAAQPALAANGGSLMNRIQRLLGQPQSRRSGVAPALLATLLAISVAIAIGATEKPAAPALKPPTQPALPLFANWTKDRPQVLLAQTPAPAQAARPNEPPTETSYQKWLNEEVVYVITDAERQAFRSLQTDEERQKFIEQFWLRRDPTPGTPENEYREEHYGRIAYASEHFGTRAIPGWKTDRGMVYIKFGPPDFTFHSQFGLPAAEEWIYRYIEGFGVDVHIEFVDSSGTGDYHMTIDPAAKNAAPVPPTPLPGVRPGRGGTAVVDVIPRSDGTLTAVYVAVGQSVKTGDALVEIEEVGGFRTTIVSPIAGTISLGPATIVGAPVRAGLQRLLTITGSGDSAFR